MSSLDDFAQAKLTALESRHLRRALVTSRRHDGVIVERGGRQLVSVSCNDYLGLSGHPALAEAARTAIEKFGLGAGASRLVTGNHPLYDELEGRLARLKGTAAACVFGSGYLANTGIIPALVGDGDLAPLAELGRLAREYDAWLMADDAHGIGVVGNGRGSTFAGDVPADVPLQMGTLSKAIGCYGGYLCASTPVVEFIKNRARTFVYSTGLPPPVVAAAIA